MNPIIKVRLRDFYHKSKCFSLRYALSDLAWWVCFYLKPPMAYRLSTAAIRYKTKWLDKYVGERYGDIISKYRESPQQPQTVDEHPIWVFWGQGEEQMPLLIRACYGQLTAHNKNVRLVTSQNVSEYIDLPQAIFDKVGSGQITWAHFSDIVRTTLLARHGGLWIDATVWVSGEMPFGVMSRLPFFSACGDVPVTNRGTRFWTSFEWNWSGWCMFARAPRYPLFSFVSEMLQAMAQNESYLLDYVLIDYLIHYACRHFPQIGRDMAECKRHPSVYRNRLASLMNEPYDEETYREMTRTDFVFKLSFRTPYKPTTPDGRETFYGHLTKSLN